MATTMAALTAERTREIVRLEQGRATTPSGQVVAALARAVQLTRAERDHLYSLAGLQPPGDRMINDHISPGVQRLLARLGDISVAVFAADWRLVLSHRNLGSHRRQRASARSSAATASPASSTSTTQPPPDRDTTIGTLQGELLLARREREERASRATLTRASCPAARAPCTYGGRRACRTCWIDHASKRGSLLRRFPDPSAKLLSESGGALIGGQPRRAGRAPADSPRNTRKLRVRPR
jgi:hypothetical protein